MNRQYVQKLLEFSHAAYNDYHKTVPIIQYQQPVDYQHPRLLRGSDMSVELRAHNLPSWAGIPEPNETPVYPHYHNFFEFVYVYQGHFYNPFEHDSFVLNENQLVLITPNKVHAPYTRYDTDIVINIMIQPSVIESYLNQWGTADNTLFRFFFNYLYNGNRAVSHLILPMNPRIQMTLESMIEEFCGQNILYQYSLEALTGHLLIELARACQQMENTPRERHSDFPIEQILEYTREHYATVTLNELSQQFFFSPAYISRTITKLTGKNFNKLLLEYRLDNACYLLKNTSLTIQEINSVLGFQDTSYLGRFFRRKYHMTLTEYRNTGAADAKITGQLSGP